MKKGDKRKQQKALKRRTERKTARSRAAMSGPRLSPHVRLARSYPLEGCWAMEGWGKNGLAVVAVARRQPDGLIVFGNYLVDTYCLGLKNTYYDADVPRGRFLAQVLPRLFPQGAPVPISADVAHEIIYGGIEYAAQLGFRPQRDFAQTQFILDPPDMHPRTGAVEFGYQGKPFYVSGPYDNVAAIQRQLTRALGPDGFHFMIGAGPFDDPGDLLPDDEPDDEWDEDEPD